MVIEHKVKDINSFKSRLKCAAEILRKNTLLPCKYYNPNGVIGFNHATYCYVHTKKDEAHIIRRHNVLNKFIETHTYIALAPLFRTMIQIMNVKGLYSLDLEDMEEFIAHPEELFKIIYSDDYRIKEYENQK